MALEKWEIIYLPSEKDKNRWHLMMNIPERELMALINRLPGTLGRPFDCSEDGYNFSIYLYELKDADVQSLRKILGELSPNGKFVGPNREELLDSLLGKVAKSLESSPAEGAAPQDNLEEKIKSEIQREIQPSADNQPPHANQPPVSESPQEPEYSIPPAQTATFDDMELNPHYTFSEFIIGPNNRFTAAAAQAVAENPGRIYNPFFIYGGVGLGKTHLMNAVGHHVHKKSPKSKIIYVTTEKFMGDVIDSIRKGTFQQLRDHYRQADLLLIDDIQFLIESESTQEEFFHTFNSLHQAGKQIIITSDRPPKQLVTLEDRLRSRFEWGLIADIKSPNLETRVAILKKKGEVDHILLDDNILLFIASKLKSNIRELEGFLKRINAYSSLTHQEVNMDLVRTLMSDLLPDEGDEPVPGVVMGSAPAPQPPPMAAQSDFYAVTLPQDASKAQQPAVQPPAADADKPADKKPSPQAPAAQQPIVQEPAPPPKKIPSHDEPHVYTGHSINLDSPEPARPSWPKPIAPSPASKLPIDPSETGLKPVEVAFFYPKGKADELMKVKERFREVIKKHKLKFRLEGIFEQAYEITGRINCAFFTERCWANNAAIAVVLGPPVAEGGFSPEEFTGLITTAMDDGKISLQLIPWAELNKDYRYLNLSLDITLLKHQG